MLTLACVAVFLFVEPDHVEQARHALAVAEKQNQVQDQKFQPIVKHAPAGTKVLFTRTWRGLPVWENALRRVNFDRNHKVARLVPATSLQPTGAFALKPEQAQRFAKLAFERVGKVMVDSSGVEPQAGIFHRQTQTRKAYRVRLQVQEAGVILPYDVYVDGEHGRILGESKRGFTYQSAAQPMGTVFRNNPPAGNLHADAYSEAAIEDALMTVPLLGLDDSGYLRGPFAWVSTDVGSFVDLSLTRYPDYQGGAAFSLEGDFLYPPGHPGFGEVNAYYWVDRAQRYLQSIDIYAHNYPVTLAVNSNPTSNAFYRATDDTIIFGVGAVDSAADVSVVLHELGHALLEDVAGWALANGGDDVNALHEGFSDFMAGLLERELQHGSNADFYPNFLSEYVGLLFGGHPTFVRSLIKPPFAYPDRTVSDYHRDGQLWSSAFYELDAKLGSDVFLPLLFEALYGMVSFTVPMDLVNAFSEADQVLNNGANSELLQAIFAERRFDTAAVVDREISVGDSILAERNSRNFLTFTTGDAPTPVTLCASEGSKIAFISTDPTSSLFDMDLLSFDEAAWCVPIAEQGTLIKLSSNTTYYIGVEAFANPVTISLAAGAETVDMQPIPEHTVHVVEAGVSHFYLEQEEPFNTLLFWVANHSGTLRFRQSVYGPARTDASSRLTESTFFSSETPEIRIVGVHEGQPITRLYVNLSSLEPGAQFRWQGLKSSEIASLELNGETTLIGAGDDLVGAINFLSEDVESLAITSDAATPFYVFSNDASNTIYASVVEGKHQVFLTPTTPNFRVRNQNLRGRIGSDGAVIVFSQGEPGSELKFQVNTESVFPVSQLVANQPLQTTLAPNEMQLFKPDLLPDMTSFDFKIIAEGSAQDQLVYQVLTDQGYALVFPNQNMDLAKGQDHYRWTRDSMPNQSFAEPSGSLQIAVANMGTEPANFEMDFSIKTNEAPIVPQPVDQSGTIPLTWYKSGSDTYWAPVRLLQSGSSERLELSFGTQSPDETLQLWIGNNLRLRPGTFHLGLLEIGAIPEAGLEVWFRYNNTNSPPETVALNYQYYDRFYSLEASQLGSTRATVLSAGRSLAKVDAEENMRGFVVAWDKTNLSAESSLRFELTKDTLVFSETIAEMTIDSNAPAVFDWLSPSAQMPLPKGPWMMQQSVNPIFNFSLFDKPAFAVDMEIALLPMATKSQLPPTVTAAQDNTQFREVMVINPTASAITVAWNDETSNLPAGGFTQRELAANAAVQLEADEPLVIFERQGGDAWESITAPSPYLQHNLLLPHLPPQSSGWQPMIALAHNGENLATIVSAAENKTLNVTPGLGSYTMAKDQSGSWSRIQTTPAEAEIMPEFAVAGTQYWMQDGHYAAEAAGVAAGRVLNLPHFPKVSDWWVGLTLANVSDASLAVTLSPYGAEGLLFDQVRHVTIPENQSVTGLLESFIDPEAINDVLWLRIHSYDGDFAGLCFIGTWRNGDDVAAFSLQTQTSPRLIFPGPRSTTGYGIAITNTVAVSGQVNIEAIGFEGSILASFSETLPAYQKLLFTANDRFPQLTPGTYYVRASAEGIRVSGLMIGGTGGATLSAQTPVLLP